VSQAQPSGGWASSLGLEIFWQPEKLLRWRYEQKMEIMKIGGILLLAGLALWIVKSVFVWWRERQDAKKWWGQYEAETNAWDKSRELESSHESEDNARRR
jgi:hypothetical protein